MIKQVAKQTKENTNQFTENDAALKYLETTSVIKTNNIIVKTFIPKGVELYISIKKPIQKAEAYPNIYLRFNVQ